MAKKSGLNSQAPSCPRRPLRAALAGLGLAGMADGTPGKDVPFAHLDAYLASPAVSLVAVCDARPERLARVSEVLPQARLYGSLDTLLEHEDPEMLSLCLPTVGRLDALERVFASKIRRVYCEKPLALTLAEACSIRQRCREAGIRMTVNYQRRWDPLIAQAKTILADGLLGGLQQVTLGYCTGLVNDASHLFDLVRYLLGEFAWVRGEFADNGPKDRNDPNVFGTFGLRNGARGALVALDRQAFNHFELDIIGTRGRLRSRNHLRALDWFVSGPEGPYQGDDYLLPHRRLEGAPEVNPLLAAVNELADPDAVSRCDPDEACADLAVAEAFLRSARSGGTREEPAFTGGRGA